ncbi:MAG: hypothetical protein JXB05_32295 [Myxococcaceae bacterium]|nr:hypothetical protein [Myxococcaceae bacterium]
MSRFWGVMSCLLLWMGCSPTKPYMARPEQLSELPEETGVVVGSIARVSSMSLYHTFVVRFSDKKFRQERIISMRHVPRGPEFDFSDFERSGDLFAFVLPAGEYAVTSARLENKAGGFETGSDVSIPFMVTSGRILYLGEISFSPVESSYVDSRSRVPLLQRLVFRDEWGRDSVLLKARYPNVAWSEALLSPMLASGAREGE